MLSPQFSKYFPEHKYKSLYEWHRHWVFNDLEFVVKARKLYLDERTSKKEYRRLGSEYLITGKDVEYFAKGKWLLSLPESFPFLSVTANEAAGIIEIKLPVDVSKNDYLIGWKFLESFREQAMDYKRAKLRRGPNDTRLLYAIWKRRKAGDKFKEIFLQYQDGKLPLYERGSTTQFKSEDQLENYYRKYYPKQPKTST